MSEKSIPSGWYFCVESSEIKAGQVIRKFVFGMTLVVWRTESGKLYVSDAICPHLGTDLSKLGKVVGEDLECFSHKYRYNGDGDCVSTAFKVLPCRSKQALKQFPVHESGGFVMVWYDAQGKKPTWHIPDEVFSSSHSVGGYVRSQFVFDVPIKTLNEDNFDIGHLYSWHQVDALVSEPVVCDGPTISVAHDFTRHSILFKNPLPWPFNVFSRSVKTRYTSTLYGHGLTDSWISVFSFDVYMRDLIWVTPLDDNKILYTTFLQRMKPQGERSVFRRVLDYVIQPLIFTFSVWRLRQEHKVEGRGYWENQSHVKNPILTEAERVMIEPYREWCVQFDPEHVLNNETESLKVVPL